MLLEVKLTSLKIEDNSIIALVAKDFYFCSLLVNSNLYARIIVTVDSRLIALASVYYRNKSHYFSVLFLLSDENFHIDAANWLNGNAQLWK
jgi:hypothetical protein